MEERIRSGKKLVKVLITIVFLLSSIAVLDGQFLWGVAGAVVILISIILVFVPQSVWERWLGV